MTMASTMPKSAAPRMIIPVRPTASSITSPRLEISLPSTIFTTIGVLGACTPSIVLQARKGTPMWRHAAVAIAVIALVPAAAAQRRDRRDIPDKYKWDLTHIYPSDAAWRAAKDTLQGEISTVRSFKGT